MEYAPRVSNPYVSKVDAGTIEVVRGFGIDLVSSGDLIQQFEATWDDEQWGMHLAAEKCTTAAYDVAWGLIAERIRSGETIRETEVQAAIMDHFQRHGMTTYSPPIVGVGPHSGDPHYEPVAGRDGVIGPGDFVLIDLWCKLDKPRAVYSDLTRVGFVGETVPAKYEQIFAIVARARDAAIALVRDAYAAGRPLQGWEVDDACRKVIVDAGYGAYFIHRTGPQHRPGSARQRRPHGQPRDSRGAPGPPPHLLLGRAGHLPGRVRRAERDQRLRGRRGASSRDGGAAEDGGADHGGAGRVILCVHIRMK